jgi:hypothetical protein
MVISTSTRTSTPTCPVGFDNLTVGESCPHAVPTHRSANAFALVARTGVFTTVRPSVAQDLVKWAGELGVKGPENLASRSPMNRCLSPRPPVSDRSRACWVTQAESGRVVAPSACTRRVEGSMKKRT